jgi:hypothetical protein
MRTTLNLDDDILLAVKELARLKGTTAGRVLSDLARKALKPGPDGSSERNGVALLPPTPLEAIVTTEAVNRLRDDA